MSDEKGGFVMINGDSDNTKQGQGLIPCGQGTKLKRGRLPKNKQKDKAPLVGIIMGSDSDLKIMETAALVMEQFSIPYEIKVVSAHRTPERMFDYARNAQSRGVEVIIAGAGGAAHLPGMVASLTPLPVIGVPVKLKELDGLDSLLSIVQMPGGVPVATVGINNAKNAGLLAARILGIKHHDINQNLVENMQFTKENLIYDLEQRLEQSWATDDTNSEFSK